MTNLVVLIGRMVVEPEMAQVGGHNFVRFKIACQRRYKNANGEYETDFIPCVAWNKQAELVCKIQKGEQFSLTGSIQVRQYETQEGEKRTSIEVVVDVIEFIGAKKKEEDQQTNMLEVLDDDDLPF